MAGLTQAPEQAAHGLGWDLLDASARAPHQPLRDRLERGSAGLEQTLAALVHADDAHLEPAGEWLLDNAYLLRRTVRLCRTDLNREREARLPRLAEVSRRGEPRVYALAQQLVEGARGALDEDQLRTAVAGFPDEPALSIGELWALPIALRIAVLERLVATTGAGATGGDQARVRDDVRALHTLEKLDWRAFFEATNQVERALREDPAGVYAGMDFATRDRYRVAVEQLAERSGHTERDVTRRVLQRSREAGAEVLAGHVGFHLVGQGRRALERDLGARVPWTQRLRRSCHAQPTACYLGCVGLVAALQEAGVGVTLARAGASPAWTLLAACLAFVPAITVGVALANWLVTSLFPPRVLPKMDHAEGLPRRCRTLVVVPCLLADREEVAALLRRLEVRYLGNQDPELGFALLTDLLDADQATSPEDEALVRSVAQGIEALNARHRVAQRAGPFHLLHRDRRWNQAQGRWLGWERKRGKLEQLNRLLLGDTEQTSFETRVGDAAFLDDVRYVLTLDADTELPPGTARQLIATFDHPLNQAAVASDTGIVTSGYTVLQPRVEVEARGEWSTFAHLFSGDTVLDLYSRAVSDAYQDLFGEGTFVGKGIYDVRAFEGCLRGRVPENALLSHDLFEGLHGRAGLVSDVAVREGYPRHYLAYTRRLHRWVRGDWQLLPWLSSWVPSASGARVPTRLTVFARWRVLDNLRRSLLAPTLLAFLGLAWTVLPASLGLTAWALAVLGLPALIGFTRGVLRNARSARLGPLLDPLRELPRSCAQWLLRVLFLPHEAAVCGDAVARTVFRLYVTRSRLLEWTPAAHSERSLDELRGVGPVWVEMRAAWLVALGYLALVAATRPGSLLWTAPLLAGWGLSPLVAAHVSRGQRPTPGPIGAASRRRLRVLARRTWLFYQQLVGPEDQWLPPDNLQEDPGPVVAHRTSPTNIGLLLTSSVAALDLGYLGARGLALRLRNTLETLRRLERYQGHPLNWYDTQTLRPLEPRYVSTVDNGNLAASLIVVQQACRQLLDARPHAGALWQGLDDDAALCGLALEALAGVDGPRPRASRALDALRREAALATQDPGVWSEAVLRLLDEQAPELERAMNALVVAAGDSSLAQEAVVWAGLLRRHLEVMRAELAPGRPWLEPLAPPAPLQALQGAETAQAAAWGRLVARLAAPPPLRGVEPACEQALRDLDELEAALAHDVDLEVRAFVAGLRWRLEQAGREARAAVADFEACQSACEDALADMDFGLLYDAQRHLFHIGFRVQEERPDPNHYDLLASEARLASFVAIARGQVPHAHWLHLGRPLTRVGGQLALVSWSGTAFEYLMPRLWMREAPGGLLERTCQAAVDEQIRYARSRGAPWGISESGFYHFDGQRNYQYRAFGVPTLGFKRGLGDDLVVAPYASLLALDLAPAAVEANVRALEALGLAGRYGLYEAVDLTPARLEAGQPQALVRSYMAHHQGMILLSLVNYLEQGAIARRFHDDPRVESADLLLREGQPRRPPLERPQAAEPRAERRPERVARPWRPAPAPWPQAHVLSNGRLTSVISASGGGWLSWRGVGLTPWRADPTLDDDGLRLYVRDEQTRRVWGVGRAAEDELEVTFHGHRVELHQRLNGLALALSVVVSPDDDAELRRLRLTNRGDEPRRVTVCSFAEVLLGDPVDGLRHPAFTRLFVHSRYDAGLDALVCERRPRSPAEQTAALLQLLVLPGEARLGGYDTARETFVGRGRTPREPLALAGDEPRLAGRTGWTLDPIMALSATLELPARGTRELALVTVAGATEADVIAVAERLRSLAALERAEDEARHRFAAGLQRRGLDPWRLPRYQQLLSSLLYPQRALRAESALLASNRLGQSALWGHAISGDLPILLVRLGDARGAALLAELLAAHELWRSQRVAIDLVVLNEQPATYESPVADHIHRTIGRAGAAHLLNRRGGVFVIPAASLEEEARTLLLTVARVVLQGSSPLEQQLAHLASEPDHLPAFQPVRSSPLDPTPTPELERPRDLLFDNGLGGFTPAGDAYVVHLSPGRAPPAPWANVITNRELGFLATTGGLGYTWCSNAGLNRITPWLNDPVSDSPPEALYLRDEESSATWSPTPLPAPGPGAYQVRHGAGSTTYLHHSHQLLQRLELFVAGEDPVKIYRLELTNTSSSPRRLTVTLLVEWILGSARHVDGPFVVPELDAEREVLLAHNPWNEAFAGRVTFLAASAELHGLTADRAEFLGRGGDRARPAALGRVGLSGTVEAGRDPCGAIQVHLDLPARGQRRLHFLLGQAGSRAEALALTRRYREPRAVDAARAVAQRTWDGLLGAVQVATPDPALDLLVNRWLLYQTVASRLWGRTGLYQSSGAYGFRDQLQDALALTHAQPEQLAERILDAGRRQFPEGDVLHWWHPGTRRGLRSRCSDDLLWLPFATAHYVQTTGDRAILERRLPYLAGEALGSAELERYGEFPESDREAALYDHCLAAIERGSTRGAQGLPLFGTGDWNDGMNRVGVAGRGESVWLGWFLHAVLTGFAPLCAARGDAARSEALTQRAGRLAAALDRAGWDGAWYLRGFYDDGTPLGSAHSDECSLDSIAQSWSVLSKAGAPARAAQALEQAWSRLVRPQVGVVLLLTPPFDRTPQDPGYIKGYAPGVRENGGQYTHAAAWLGAAFAASGDGDRAYEILRLVSPIRHAMTPEQVETYRVEPYVVAADVYAVPPHAGRGGWTWYTGSAAWLYRLAVEGILGLRREAGALRLAPCLPEAWPGYTVVVRRGTSTYRIQVERVGSGQEVTEVLHDGARLAQPLIPLLDDGREHTVRLRLG